MRRKIIFCYGLVCLLSILVLFGATGTHAQSTVQTNGIRTPQSLIVAGFVSEFSGATITKMNQMGLSWAKHRMHWQPSLKAQDYYYLIDGTHAQNMQVLLTINGNPEHTAPLYAPEYAQFVAELAAYGADAIEVWEQPNTSAGWQVGEIDARQYVSWLKQTYQAVKTVSPSTLVISGGLQPTVQYKGCDTQGCDDLPFLQEFIAAGGAAVADCVGMHYNEGLVAPSEVRNDPRKPTDYYTRYFHGMEYVYGDVLRNQRPLCITELGYLSAPPPQQLPATINAGINLSAEQQARYLAEAVQLAANSTHIRMVVINSIDTPANLAPSSTFNEQQSYAIIRPDGQCPACAALQPVLAKIRAAAPAQQTQNATPSPTPPIALGFAILPGESPTLTAQDLLLLQAQNVTNTQLQVVRSKAWAARQSITANPPTNPTPVLALAQVISPTAMIQTPQTPVIVLAQPTAQPPTAQPPTAQPPTDQPPTAQPPTAQPPTAQPPTAQPPTAQPAAPAPSFALGGQVHGFGQNAVAAMQQAGMTWVKHQVRWSTGTRLSDVSYLIGDSHSKGFKVLLGVVIEPGDTSPANFGSYAQFVGQLSASGADAIEVHNEPNLPREWRNGEISPASYTDLLRQAYQAIKANNPQTLVISAAPAPTGFFSGGCNGNGCDDLPFLQGMVANGAGAVLDCIGAHYNEGLVSPWQRSGDPRGSSEHYTRYYQGILDTYRAVFGGQKPVCFTEVGFLTGEGYGELPSGYTWRGLPNFGGINMTLADHARFHAEAVQVARQRGDVMLQIVWNVDFTQRGDDPHAAFAIIRPDGSCPACTSLAAATR
jgi:hypothetical protein